MADPTITNIDNSVPWFKDSEFADILVTAAGADTFVKGTILAQNTAAPTKAILYVRGGSTNGNGEASMILGDELVFSGAGDLKARVMRAGGVRLDKLVIDAGTAVSNVEVLSLQDHNIFAREVTDLSELDNQ